MAAVNKGDFVRNYLITTLQKLTDDEFKKFKVKLSETPMKELVHAGGEFHNKSNRFQKDASREGTIEALIGNFGRTHALTAAATVMEKIGRMDLALDLRGQVQELQETSHGLPRKQNGIVQVVAGALIAGGSGLALTAMTPGAQLLFPFASAVFGVCLAVEGIRSRRRKAKDV